MKTIRYFIAFCFICFCLTGCPAKWKLIIKNATNGPISVQVGETTLKEIRSGETVRVDYPRAVGGQFYEQEIVVRSSGRIIAREKAHKIAQSAQSQYPNIYIIIDANGIEVR